MTLDHSFLSENYDDAHLDDKIAFTLKSALRKIASVEQEALKY